MTLVYLDPESDIEREMIAGHSESPIRDWLKARVNGWRYSPDVRHLRGDDHDYTAISFYTADEAHLFRMTFDKKVDEVVPEPVEWRYGEDPADPKSLTFPKSGRSYCYGGQISTKGKFKGTAIAYHYGTERNALGYFVGWQSADGRATNLRIARRKKKDVMAWCRKKAAS